MTSQNIYIQIDNLLASLANGSVPRNALIAGVRAMIDTLRKLDSDDSDVNEEPVLSVRVKPITLAAVRWCGCGEKSCPSCSGNNWLKAGKPADWRRVAGRHYEHRSGATVRKVAGAKSYTAVRPDGLINASAGSGPNAAAWALNAPVVPKAAPKASPKATVRPQSPRGTRAGYEAWLASQ